MAGRYLDDGGDEGRQKFIVHLLVRKSLDYMFPALLAINFECWVRSFLRTITDGTKAEFIDVTVFGGLTKIWM